MPLPRETRSGATWITTVALAACGATPPPPLPGLSLPPPPVAAPPVTTRAPPPPRLGLIDVPRAPEAAAARIAPPAPMDRVIVPVPLPPGTPEVVAVDGRDERDVWLLAGAGAATARLLHWDGTRIEALPGPSCAERADRYHGLVVLPGELLVRGTVEWRGIEALFEGRRDSRGRWTCETRLWPSRVLAVGADLLRFEGVRLTSAGGTLPSPPWRWYGGPAEISARSPDSLWVYVPQGDSVAHGNGVAWESRPPGVPFLQSLQVDREGVAWAVGGEDREAGDVLLSWDEGAHAFRAVPSPSDLVATRVRANDARDVWLVGPEHVHRWDGERFHRAPTPLPDVRAAWLGPRELWLAGSKPEPSHPSAGAAYRFTLDPTAGIRP
jgi:hypothetical protein